jgi:hypothetical protein
MTMVELMMALSVFSVIGLATGMMLNATASATSASTDGRQVSVQRTLIGSRIETAVRASTKFLAAGEGYLVLWVADTRTNEAPNLSELRRIDFDAQTGELKSYVAEFPENWTADQIAAADTEYDPASDFEAVTTTLKDNAMFMPTTWSKRVTGLDFALKGNNPQSARLVLYELTLDGHVTGASTISYGAAALRAQ